MNTPHKIEAKQETPKSAFSRLEFIADKIRQHKMDWPSDSAYVAGLDFALLVIAGSERNDHE